MALKYLNIYDGISKHFAAALLYSNVLRNYFERDDST